MSPSRSDDLTDIIVPRLNGYVVFHSPDSAEHTPDYVEAAVFPTLSAAGAYFGEPPDPSS